MEFPDKYMNSLKVLNAPKYLMYTHYDCRNLHLGLNKKAFFSDLDSHEVVKTTWRFIGIFIWTNL